MRVTIERRSAIKSAYKAGLSIDEIAVLTGFDPKTINKLLFPSPGSVKYLCDEWNNTSKKVMQKYT